MQFLCFPFNVNDVCKMGKVNRIGHRKRWYNTNPDANHDKEFSQTSKTDSSLSLHANTTSNLREPGLENGKNHFMFTLEISDRHQSQLHWIGRR
jgi:hypothetical protein